MMSMACRGQQSFGGNRLTEQRQARCFVRPTELQIGDAPWLSTHSTGLDNETINPSSRTPGTRTWRASSLPIAQAIWTIDDRHNHYQRGVGSAGLFRKVLGGITGFGGRTFVKRALHKLEDNIERNDTVIDVVGFSPGAALALDFVNEIAKGKAKLRDGRIPTVRFLGLWDCVPSFGIPISPLNIGWDLDLPSKLT
jgi:hypothetical protein